MGLWDKLKGELIDIIEWLDDSRDTIVWRYPRSDNEIKNGAKLIVRASQVAALVDQGQLGDIFHPGTHTLSTPNLPILGKLKGWKYGFESPFKAEVYFVNTRSFTDRKWGTKNPIMMRDPEFGPVRVRAFGTFAFRVSDPAVFLVNIVGTDARFTVDEFGDQLRDLLVARFADALAESKIAVLDVAAHQDELGAVLRDRIKPDFTGFGIEITSLAIENISLPPEVEGAIDKRTSMGVIGNMDTFTRFQAANAMEAAAKNPGGAAGLGAGLGAGFAIAGQMTGAMANASGASQQSPPPIPGVVTFYVALDGKQSGPFDAATLRDQITAGRIARDTLVWKPGMSAWLAAGTVGELQGWFDLVPPPLPK